MVKTQTTANDKRAQQRTMELTTARTNDPLCQKTTHKSRWIMMIAYNLVRSQMQKAAYTANVKVWQLSFKAILDTVTSCHESLKPLAGAPNKLKNRLREITSLCSQKLIDIRPNRREPRATKRRPKSYQLLTKPRHIFKEVPHRGNYYKTA